MTSAARPTATATLIALVGLNLVPLAGVLLWGWKSFDLIFLYWMENVVIGVLTLGRMIVRPYSHPIDLIFPLFIAPFFVVHFGAFCWGHGSFIVSLFGPESLGTAGLQDAALTTIRESGLLPAVLSLAAIQVLDWIRDVRTRGLGADNIKVLMIKPYRRIVVLHLTILGAGFALGALDEPTVGLMLLVLVKSASDVWHWRQDAAAKNAEDEFTFSEKHLSEMRSKFPHPVVTVNGKERSFDSFAEMRRSREVRMAQSLMRLIGAAEELKAMNAYFDLRIAEEERGGS